MLIPDHINMTLIMFASCIKRNKLCQIGLLRRLRLRIFGLEVQCSQTSCRLEVIDEISVLKCDNYNVVKNNFNRNNRLKFEWNDKYRLFSYV